MRHRRLANFHSLKRQRVRQTWNKHNLFNLTRLREPHVAPKTFFQQKWMAKASTRAYHGEHIRERQWERMFSRRLPGVVDMDPSYLARHDGSEHSSGRGSGRTPPPQQKGQGRKAKAPEYTPYMQMIYGPMERRLDIAIFRALFASSTRQARQMCIHGAVTVNGQKMVHPTYQLNPGDMFQVDIEKVMIATGREKPSAKQLEAIDGNRRAQEANAAKKLARALEAAEAAEAAESKAAPSTTATDAPPSADATPAPETRTQKQQIAALNDIARQAKALSQARGDMAVSARRKQAVRALIKDVKGHLARVKKTDPSTVDATIDDVTTLLSRFFLFTKKGAKEEQKEPTKESFASPPSRTAQETDADADADADALRGLSMEQSIQIYDDVEAAIVEDRDNPEDRSKPYMTPWKPKPFMPAFAFIPRYLEVNQSICAAVYLRHPVARKGMGEVPTPFGRLVNELAFNWYLRRG